MSRISKSIRLRIVEKISAKKTCMEKMDGDGNTAEPLNGEGIVD